MHANGLRACCSFEVLQLSSPITNKLAGARFYMLGARQQHSVSQPDTHERSIATMPRPLRSKKARGKVANDETIQFVDRRLVRACGGNGGDGMLSFLSVKFKEFCGADGGDGGNGGHVVFEASHNAKDLSKVSKTIIGPRGENGHSKNCHGAGGGDLIVEVPLGTHVNDVKRRKLVAELNYEGQRYVGARGGLGGKGNGFFMNNENRAPAVRELGAPGEERILDVEMMSIADVGFIGYPNAGKSTLLRAISRARPKVASYPFTTLRPHVGRVLYDDYSSITFADIPGIIEDAHKNRGLGVEFLRHVQRCFCLVYVVDVSQPDAVETLHLLRRECKQFDPSLLDRRSLVVANKIDEIDAEDKFLSFCKELEPEFEVLGISGRYGWGLTNFLDRARILFDEERAQRSSGVT